MHGRGPLMDESRRRRIMNPEAILTDIGLSSGLNFMDVGCGEGFFTLPAARIVGSEGRVYGVDIDSERIDDLRAKAAGEGLTNVELKAGRAEEIVFCRGCADIVFFANVLHDFEEPVSVLKNARKMLKDQGKLVNLDWKKMDTPFGPPLSIRFDEPTATRLIEPCGFKVETVRDSGPYHYLIIAYPA
jgi:ubiquinone/menaquinone biosynthesis C-methylase UbiE